MVGLCDEEDCLTKESYHNDSVDESESCQYNEKNELTKGGDRVRTVCTCGALLSNHQAPNDIQLRVYTDEEWEKIFDCDSIHPWMIPLPKYDVWRCPVCKSIYVYERSKQTPIMTYRLET